MAPQKELETRTDEQEADMPEPLTGEDTQVVRDVILADFSIEELRADPAIRFVVWKSDDSPGELEVKFWPAELHDRVQGALRRAGYPTRPLRSFDGGHIAVCPKVLPPEIVASEKFARARKAMQLDERALSVARRVVEDVLVEFRDHGISTDSGNGLVIRSADGTSSSIQRLSTEDGLQIGISAYFAALHAIETGEV